MSGLLLYGQCHCQEMYLSVDARLQLIESVEIEKATSRLSSVALLASFVYTVRGISNRCSDRGCSCTSSISFFDVVGVSSTA